jgi:hypothetical protein
MGTRGTVRLASLVFLLAAGLAPLDAFDAQAQQHRDPALPGCGICYPGGYDLNTVGSLQGKLLDVQLPEDGPVRLVVCIGGNRWVVLASPTRFWMQTELHLVPGDTVTVRGSKTMGADGNLYLVAQEIQRTGEGTFTCVRDRRGVPLWRKGRQGGGTPGSGSEVGSSLGVSSGRGGACLP